MSDLLGDDFRAWFEARLVALHMWAANLVETGRTVQPGIIVFRADDEMAFMPVDLDSIAAKNTAAALHRLTATTPMAREGAIFVSEIWILTDPPKDEVERLRTDRDGIAHHPKRTEAVLWSALRGERQLFAKSDISRKPNRLGPWTISDPRRAFSSGRLIADEHDKRRGH